MENRLCLQEKLSVYNEDIEAKSEEVGESPISISLNSDVGIDNPKTMKLEGKVGRTKVVVMVDPGVTHNFITPKLVREMAMSVTSAEEFGVSLGIARRLNWN